MNKRGKRINSNLTLGKKSSKYCGKRNYYCRIIGLTSLWNISLYLVIQQLHGYNHTIWCCHVPPLGSCRGPKFTYQMPRPKIYLSATQQGFKARKKSSPEIPPPQCENGKIIIPDGPHRAKHRIPLPWSQLLKAATLNFAVNPSKSQGKTWGRAWQAQGRTQ